MAKKSVKKKSVKKKSFQNLAQPKAYYLNPGDLIDVIAPASACAKDHLIAALKWIESKGFRARVSSDILNPQLFLSQSDEYRFNDLKKAIYAKDSKAVWCLRGGYGSFRLWPEILKLKVIPKPKLFIGLSDITSLHHFLNHRWNWPTIHGPMLDRLGQNKLSHPNQIEVLDLIQGKNDFLEFTNLKALNVAAQKKKIIKGKLRGGNLCTYMLSLGTSLHPQFNSKDKVILFFEDIGERGYKIDRFLQHLKQAQVFKNVVAIVFGDFVDGLEANGQNLVDETLMLFAQQIKIPVFCGVQSGHGEIQRPLFFNTTTTLSCGSNPRMVIYSHEIK